MSRLDVELPAYIEKVKAFPARMHNVEMRLARLKLTVLGNSYVLTEKHQATACDTAI